MFESNRLARPALSLFLFPQTYVHLLDKLVYPSWYVACFSESPMAAPMWGTYGDGHRGICLKFCANLLNSEPVIDLYRVCGMKGTGGKLHPTHDFRPHHFYKVAYSDGYTQIDFFRSLGTLSTYKLQEFWYRNNEAYSTCADDVFIDEDEWRRRYWRLFDSLACKKTKEWKHEKEFRLLLTSQFHDFSDTRPRLLQYQFTNLSAIIFGANTSEKDILQIMRVISEKCKSEKREKFHFYQMRYSRRIRSFELIPLDLITFP